ncbi:ATP-binding protein [Variovorax sp. M-6]|uniref:ATP-binding protein n=1 Tax=Variovorax sp. M-6 TaxID=3233041 RepID=UPI003F9C78B9
MVSKVGLLARGLNSNTALMALIGLLGIASYFFGQPMAIELHWFWMAMLSFSIVALSVMLFVRSRTSQRRDDELHAILDAVPHVLFFKDTDLRYREVNAEFERTFHIDKVAVIGEDDMKLFGAELHDRFVSQDKELMASGEARTYHEEMTIDGAVRSHQTRKRPVRDRRGKLRGVVGVAIDVTEQKLLQRQLEDAHDGLGIALEAARMGTWELDLSTDELQADERCRQVLGLKGDSLDVSMVYARMHPDDRDDIKQRVERAITHKSVSAYEFRVVDDSGAIRWIEGFSSPNRLRRGNNHLIGVNRDITERRMGELAVNEAKLQAERVLAELEESQLELELALSSGGLGVWRSVTRLRKGAEPTGRELGATLIVADPRIHEICGRDADLSYRDMFKLLHPDDRRRVAVALDQAYRKGTGAYRDQFRICNRDGVVRTVDVRGSVTTGAEAGSDSMLVSFTGIAKDITKDEELKANLMTKAEEARSALDAKGQFLAMMSHEVRTPLNGVLGMIDLVLDTPLADEQRAMLLRSRESSVALLTIINDILDFSKIEARMLDVEHRALSLSSLIEDVCATLLPEAKRKAISLEFSVDGQIPKFIVGDSVRLRQILTNLIGNAVKFTSQGGVKVGARKGPGGLLQLTVEDTGIGIDPRATESLFQPFRQANIATTRRYGGTGLGLTIVKQLVELMQGTVRCDSELDRGSRFTVTLPLRPWIPAAGSLPARTPAASPIFSPASSTAGTAEAAMPIGRGRKVLLAEDHEVNREVITLQLAKIGIECDVAEDGEQAWEKLMAPGASYALLLTDCNMPRLDGYDLTKRVRAHEASLGLPRLPIVALTANALRDEAERCLALGMDAYLSKPLQLHELRQALADVLAQQAATSGVSDAGASSPSPPYPALAELCGGRLDKVAGLVRIFVAATEQDLKSMDQAAESGDHLRLRQLAHRLSSACHQLGETKVVGALQAIERSEEAEGIGPKDALLGLYRSARDELVSVLERASEFIRLQGHKA